MKASWAASRYVLAAGVTLLAAVLWAQIRPETAPAEIVVDTSPGARIFLDNVLKGTASAKGRLVISEPKEGEHVLRVERHGKKNYTKAIVVRRGRTIPVNAELTDLPGTLEILTEANAEVLLNGIAVGRTDGTGRLLLTGLKPLEYKLRVVSEGYNPWETAVAITPGAAISITRPLKAITAGPVGLSLRPPHYVLQRRLVAYPEGVQSAFFARDGDELVSWGEYDGVIVWDRRTGKQLRTIRTQEFRESGSFGRYFLVSPDQRWVAMRTLGASHPTRLVDTRTGRIVREFSGFGYPRAFTFDSKRIVVGAHLGYTNAGPDDEAALFNVDTGQKVKAWKDWSMRAFALSPDGKWIAGGDEYVTLWDAVTGEQARRMETKALRLAFSADSRFLAINSQKQIELWETPPGLQGRTIEAPKAEAGEGLEFGDLAFVPGSPYLITAVRESGRNAQWIYLWELQTGKNVADWPVEGGRDIRIVLSNDGQWMAVAGQDLTVWRRQ